jgi:hypothetical protein
MAGVSPPRSLGGTRKRTALSPPALAGGFGPRLGCATRSARQGDGPCQGSGEGSFAGPALCHLPPLTLIPRAGAINRIPRRGRLAFGRKECPGAVRIMAILPGFLQKACSPILHFPTCVG